MRALNLGVHLLSRAILLAAVFVGVLFLGPRLAGAQTAGQTEERIRITPEIRQAIANKLGLDPNSARMREIEADYYRGGSLEQVRGNQSGAKSGASSQRVSAENPPIIFRHIRGKDGKPFASAPVLDPKIFESAPVLALAEKKQDYMRQELMKLLEPKPLPDCPSSKTEKSTLGKARLKDSITHFDMLFVRAETAPDSPEELVGFQPMVIRYRDDRPDENSLAALGVGINCLPFRLRITSRSSYAHIGLDALKNYDEQPDGKGELHPLTRDMFKVQDLYIE